MVACGGDHVKSRRCVRRNVLDGSRVAGPGETGYHDIPLFDPPIVPKTDAQTPDFERMLKELETLVARLEQGELSLDESLRQFERGVELARLCEQALKAAEQKVEILLEHNAEAAVVPFESDSG